jgi:hypothetical protein
MFVYQPIAKSVIGYASCLKIPETDASVLIRKAHYLSTFYSRTARGASNFSPSFFSPPILRQAISEGFSCWEPALHRWQAADQDLEIDDGAMQIQFGPVMCMIVADHAMRRVFSTLAH